MYQVCGNCGQVQLIPRALCSSCHAVALAWKQSAGSGIVLTFTVVHRAPLPAFKEETPYGIAIIDMDEGFRLMVNVSARIQSELAIGRRVRLGLREVEGVKLPHAEELL